MSTELQFTVDALTDGLDPLAAEALGQQLPKPIVERSCQDLAPPHGLSLSQQGDRLLGGRMGCAGDQGTETMEVDSRCVGIDPVAVGNGCDAGMARECRAQPGYGRLDAVARGGRRLLVQPGQSGQPTDGDWTGMAEQQGSQD